MKRICTMFTLLLSISSALLGASAKARITLTIIDPPTVEMIQPAAASSPENTSGELKIKNLPQGVHLEHFVERDPAIDDSSSDDRISQNQLVHLVYN